MLRLLRSRTRLPIRPTHCGVAAIEAAVVLPILVIVTLGAIDIAQYINLAQLVVNASREGARVASRHATESTQDVERVVSDYIRDVCPQLSDSELSGALAITLRNGNNGHIANGDLTTIDSGDPISVRVEFAFGAIRWLNGPECLDGNVSESITFSRRE